jgi:hypothetical protein
LDDSDQQQLLIHATHGLNLSGGEDDSSREDNLNLTVNDDNNELPKSIIVTSVALMVFDNEGIKVSLFNQCSTSSFCPTRSQKSKKF